MCPRGTMWFQSALLAVLLVTTTVADICEVPACNCLPDAHPAWKVVNCTLASDQILNILEGNLPESTTELIISGGAAVQLGTHSLTRLRNARYIHIDGAKNILIRKNAAVNLNVVSIFLDIQNCDLLRIESKSFVNIKGPLTTTIKNCEFVSIEGETFSWLLQISITNVLKLEVGPGTFTLDSTAANIGEHGPALMIILKNLTIDNLPKQTFGSSAAMVLFDHVNIKTIQTETFSANTINEVLMINSTIKLFEADAIAQKTLINQLEFQDSNIYKLESKALQSAVQNLTIMHSRIDQVDEGGINITVATVVVIGTNFTKINTRGLDLSTCTNLQLERNVFKNLDAKAIVAGGNSMHHLIFIKNAIHEAHQGSLTFIGQTHSKSPSKVAYVENYFAETCHCNIDSWLAAVMDIDSADSFVNQSLCTVEELLARCFNEPDQNMVVQKFFDQVCNVDISIKCEPYKTKTNGAATEIKNPIFPEKSSENVGGLSGNHAKVIAIIIVCIFGLIALLIIISFVNCIRRRGYCAKLKDLLFSSHMPCCDRFCGYNGGLDNARSISQLSVNEYSERHRLNEPHLNDDPRVEDVLPQTIPIDTFPRRTIARQNAAPEAGLEGIVPMDDKTTQTLPEELTKELLESLREKLDNPEDYVEAREMIEHLYELIKVEENLNNTPSPNLMGQEENIYDLPFQNTMPRVGKNKKDMVSIGTKTPSLDKLKPLSPYNRKTALSHDYFEPKDLAVHLYAEIANADRDRKKLMNTMPDVVGDQAIPRGPYLRAVRDKFNDGHVMPTSTNSSPTKPQSPLSNSTIKSNKSISSNSSAKMMNRPLPEKPTTFDPGEGTSY